MEQILGVVPRVVEAILGGGPGVVGVLIAGIGFAFYDRYRAYQMLADAQARIDRMVDKNHEATLALAGALDALKDAFEQLRGSLDQLKGSRS